MARFLIRHLQPVIHNLTRGRWIKGNAWKLEFSGAAFSGQLYDFLTSPAAPTVGQITCTSGGLQVRVSDTSKGGSLIGPAMARAKPGWKLTIGPVTAVVAEIPTAQSGGVWWLVPVTSFTAPANGEYSVTLRPGDAVNPTPVITLDTDGDGLQDTKLADLPGGGSVTIDADSLNIDWDGDGDADLEIPLP